jgi:hypothetical protein
MCGSFLLRRTDEKEAIIGKQFSFYEGQRVFWNQKYIFRLFPHLFGPKGEMSENKSG